jgi:hypothetical protein
LTFKEIFKNLVSEVARFSKPLPEGDIALQIGAFGRPNSIGTGHRFEQLGRIRSQIGLLA